MDSLVEIVISLPIEIYWWFRLVTIANWFERLWSGPWIRRPWLPLVILLWLYDFLLARLRWAWLLMLPWVLDSWVYLCVWSLLLAILVIGWLEWLLIIIAGRLVWWEIRPEWRVLGKIWSLVWVCFPIIWVRNEVIGREEVWIRLV
jgi:hypothetical protein